jgi:hypothetical protein
MIKQKARVECQSNLDSSHSSVSKAIGACVDC